MPSRREKLLHRRLALVMVIPGLLTLVGTVGYCWIEDWPVFDAIYMTVITLTTVGFMEVRPMSSAGRTFTMILAMGGIYAFFYAASEVMRTVFTGEIGFAFGKRRMEKALSEMRDHLIVCGFGRMGWQVCHEFVLQKVPFVVIDEAEDFVSEYPFPGGVPLEGDATSDEVLVQAGVERARALVALLATDADNLYITMSARLLNEKLYIVSRAEEESSEKKLLRAGANRGISPYVIGGVRVAQAVLQPTVLDFIELATRTEHLELQIEETRISPSSVLANRSLAESRIRQEFGLIIVAIKRTDGQMLFNPDPETVILSGDILIALGDRRHLDRLEVLAKSSSR